MEKNRYLWRELRADLRQRHIFTFVCSESTVKQKSISESFSFNEHFVHFSINFFNNKTNAPFAPFKMSWVRDCIETLSLQSNWVQHKENNISIDVSSFGLARVNTLLMDRLFATVITNENSNKTSNVETPRCVRFHCSISTYDEMKKEEKFNEGNRWSEMQWQTRRRSLAPPIIQTMAFVSNKTRKNRQKVFYCALAALRLLMFYWFFFLRSVCARRRSQFNCFLFA